MRINNSTIRIGINILRIKEIKIKRNSSENKSCIIISGIGEKQIPYDHDYIDTSEDTFFNYSDVQCFAIYTDNNQCEHILKKDFYNDGAIFDKMGNWVDLRGKVEFRRIHLKDFEMVLSIKGHKNTNNV